MLLTLQVTRDPELLLTGIKDQPICPTLHTFNCKIQESSFPTCLSPLVPPVISLSPPEEEVEVDVEEGAEKEEEAAEPCQRRDEEPSTSAEHTKQEVRNPLLLVLCVHGGFAMQRIAGS